jgi:hypothetical protein
VAAKTGYIQDKAQGHSNICDGCGGGTEPF